MHLAVNGTPHLPIDFLSQHFYFNALYSEEGLDVMKAGRNVRLIPNSCGSSWQKTAIEVLIPPVSPALKAAPAKDHEHSEQKVRFRAPGSPTLVCEMFLLSKFISYSIHPHYTAQLLNIHWYIRSHSTSRSLYSLLSTATMGINTTVITFCFLKETKAYFWLIKFRSQKDLGPGH